MGCSTMVGHDLDRKRGAYRREHGRAAIMNFDTGWHAISRFDYSDESATRIDQCHGEAFTYMQLDYVVNEH